MSYYIHMTTSLLDSKEMIVNVDHIVNIRGPFSPWREHNSGTISECGKYYVMVLADCSHHNLTEQEYTELAHIISIQQQLRR